MSVIRPKPPEDPIEYDPTPLLTALGLSAAADEGLDRVRETAADDPVVQLPERLLADYNGTAAGKPARRTRGTSDLHAILQAARLVRDAVDRVLVSGAADAVQAVRAVFACCCHPFHNELSRGERGGRPRLSFAGHPLDADSLQGLVDLVAPAGAARTGDLLEQWGVVLCDHGDDATASLLLRLLVESVHGDRSCLAERVVIVGKRTGPAADLAASIGCRHVFTLPDVPRGRGVFTPACLLPAALVGIDVVRLLQGAVAMNRRFREATAERNPVLAFAAVSRLASRRLHAMPGLFSPETDRLLDLVRWHDQLATGSIAPPAGGCGAGVQITRLLAGESRRNPAAAVPLARSGGGPDHDEGAPDVTMAGMPAGLGETMPTGDDGRGSGRPIPESPAAAAAVIRLPRIDEHAIGQLLQMLLLAAVVEERLAE